jgi:predicted secreted protein
MKRHLSLLLLALIIGLAWLTVGWTGNPHDSRQQPRGEVKVITIQDNGKEIRIRQGDLFRVELEAPGGDGYLWQIEDGDVSRLHLISQSTRVLLAEGKMGAPVVSVFIFRAILQGQTVLTIDYYRPWEGRATSEKTFSLKINIS